MTSLTKLVISLSVFSLLMASTFSGQKKNNQIAGGDPELQKKIDRFAPTVLTADTSRLSPNDRKALDKIIAAAKYMDPLFLRQVWSGNEALYEKLKADTTPIGRQRLHYFLINDGPWSRLDSNEPFIEGVPKEKPPNANYYPDDMTKEEFNSWVQTLSPDDKQKATGFFWL